MIYDQTSPVMLEKLNGSFEARKTEYNYNKNYIKKIESNIPSGSMIFQLPYMAFPENGRMNDRVSDYSQAIGYLFSNELKWSYGTVKGREQDTWMRYISNLPIDKLVYITAIVGFKGVLIDRWGYNDQNIENLLRQYSNENSIESENKRYIFYNLNEYINKIKNELGNENFIIEKNKILDTNILNIYKILNKSELIDFKYLKRKEVINNKFNIDFIKNPIKNTNVPNVFERDEGIIINGWLIDIISDNSPYKIHVKINDLIFDTRIIKRQDVADHFGDQKYINSGFEAYISSEYLNNTNYNLSLVIISQDERYYLIENILEFSIK